MAAKFEETSNIKKGKKKRWDVKKIKKEKGKNNKMIR